MCKCKNVTKKQIETVIENASTNWIDVSMKTGAGTYCGGCIKALRKLCQQAEAKRSAKCKQPAAA